MISTEFPITRLSLWIDDVPRSGPENMAIDEWLLETMDGAILRVYRWSGKWGSLGRFGRLNQSIEAFPDLQFVRRLSGGGIVDHQRDWTYTLVIPKNERLACLRGSESYRHIHTALISALIERFDVRLNDGQSGSGAASCFENPVSYDLESGDGKKIAGAGQRRTKMGLMHQGSVQLPCSNSVSIDRSKRLAEALALDWQVRDFTPPSEIIVRKVAERYGNPEWTQRR